MDDQLRAAFDGAWQLLVRGAGDRHSPVHTPVVASVAADGTPAARVMVLRAADRAAATLRFHTDARSPKVSALADGAVQVLAYHPGAAIQLRLSGTARIDPALADTAWAQATPFARRCYLAVAAPGSPLPAPGSGLPPAVEGRKPSEAELTAARPNFAVLVITLTAIDWLHLAQTGHRRARFRCDENGWHGEWLVP